MEQAARLDYLLAETQRLDPDRYLCALFAPADRREPLLALAVLGRQLARVPHIVTQPMAGLIRYQWWRDAIDEAAAGRPREQPVVEGLAAGLRPTRRARRSGRRRPPARCRSSPPAVSVRQRRTSRPRRAGSARPWGWWRRLRKERTGRCWTGLASF